MEPKRAVTSWSFFLVIWMAIVGTVAAGVLQSSAAQAQPIAATHPQPNVLWILAEDMGPELGVYATLGNRLAAGARTPNLDRLARRGMLFTHAFSTSPVCSPSRSAFNTGMYQFSIGAHHHRSHRKEDPSSYPFPLPEGVRVVSDWMRHAGYYTGNIVHFPEGIAFQGTGKTDWNFTYRGQPFDTDRWAELKVDEPFYAQINFPETHRGSAWDTAHERIEHPASPKEVVIPPYYPDHPVVRENWAQYLNAIMSLDEKVGTVLELLERDGLAEKTVVVFMADHGRAMVRGKQWPYDSGLRIPLIVFWPEGIPAPEGYRPGIVSRELVSLIDVTATTLAFAGVPRPERMQGRVFFGSGRAAPRLYVFGGRDRGDETVDRIRTVRSKRFRYLRNDYPERPFLQTNRYKEATSPTIWVMRKLHAEGRLTPEQARLLAPTRPSEELYDLEADPYEVHNLADDPAYAEILQQMRQTLDDWIERIDDQGRFSEDPAVAEYYDQQMQQNYNERIERLRKEWGIE